MHPQLVPNSPAPACSVVASVSNLIESSTAHQADARGGALMSNLPAEADRSLKDRYAEVKQRVADAAKRSGRSAESVILVAVSKNAGPEQIRELMRLGQVDFGENRIQQLIQRAAVLDEWLGRQKAMPGASKTKTGGVDDLWKLIRGQPDATGGPSTPLLRWHMIGHLQRNKARKAVDLCRLIHTVDSLRLAEELQLLAFKRDEPVEVLLQVNCSLEPQKYGCAIAAAVHLAEQIETMVHVKVRGLMTMAAYTESPDEARRAFGRCRELFDEIRDSGVVGPSFNVLSMGMSNDYEVAIEEGSNLVRVGSALFGPPQVGDEGEVEGD
jgi:PLP dependent protein